MPSVQFRACARFTLFNAFLEAEDLEGNRPHRLVGLEIESRYVSRKVGKQKGLGRGFFGTFIAVVLPASLIALGGGPAVSAAGDLLIARVLAAFAEATLTGMATAILVAYHPQWLATYADRLYLPPAPGS